MENEAAPQENSGGTVLAILIAIVTVATAVVAWRASLIEDSAGDADFAGLLASVNVEETRALNQLNAYENYGAYTRYWQYSGLADLAATDLETADEEEAVNLDSQVLQYNNLTLASETLFPNRFLTRDGRYDVKRQMGEMWADASREKDLAPDPQFAEADSLRSRVLMMLGAGAILALGLVFFTLVESMEGEWRHTRMMVIIGSLLSVAGVVLAVLVDVNVI